ncbi:MAG: type II toxin-antitoxin system RelB/DinJ family antitoxin [Synergistaceae bacterium]|jgi:DNA-damage-inducible protein J|nr:type II toxin-antitoxin system RelB/DinJ family antitoxin [Synergistaceae bacterium]
MSTTNVQVRVPSELKQKADSLFESMGIDTGTAIRIFLAQSVGRRALPFDMTEPRDVNGYTPAQAERLLRARRQMETGNGRVHDLAED